MWLSGTFATCSGVPVATMVPPREPPSGPRSNQSVGGLNNVKIMLNNEHRIPCIDETLQNIKKLPHIFHMQARGGLVENVERFTRLPTLQLARELYALSLAARKRGGRLAQSNVAQAHIVQRLELTRQARQVLEKLERLVDRHIEHVVHVFAAVCHLQGLAVIAHAAAHLARHINIGQEVHLDFDLAITFARLAAATAHIEAEAARRIAARLRLLRARKQRANVIPQADIRRRIRTRRATDGALVDIDNLIKRLVARELAVFARAMARVIDAVRERQAQACR